MKNEINTHNLIVNFGKHRGEKWTRLPVSYLKWLANEGEDNENQKIAHAELKRRGSHTIPNDIEISPHAIDKASIRLRHNFKQTRRNKDEGLYSWLLRNAVEALKEVNEDGNAYKNGIRFVFKRGHIYNTLLTVMKYQDAADTIEKIDQTNPEDR